MDLKEKTLLAHREWKGKIEVISRTTVRNREELSVAYTPGVAEPCLAIKADPELSYVYTRRANMVAVITDGSAVLGLGNIGGVAGMPVMEGKCVLFKEFAGVDAFPICVDRQDVEGFCETVRAISGSFGAINLEDIGAPRCFEIERRLRATCGIPVFHDDQHGTAVVVLAGLMNALKVVGKKLDEVHIAMSGAGAAGSAIARLLLAQGAKHIKLSDKYGLLYPGREDLDPVTEELAELTNPECIKGDLKTIIPGADVFIGVSAPRLLTQDMVRSMAKDAIVFALANPVPEIMPDEAKAAGAAVVCSGRSDYPNQVNNVLAFPGIFRGTLDAHVGDVTDAMKLAAANALSALVSDEERSADYCIPAPFDPRVCDAVSKAVYEAALNN